MERNKTVEEYLEKKPEFKKELSKLRKIMLDCGLEEDVKWGMPAYLSNGKNIIGLAAFKEYAGIWFHHGSFLKDKGNKLVNAQEGKTKGMRQWRFASVKDIDEKLVKFYVKEAIQNQEDGKAIKPVRKTPTAIAIPAELSSALKEDKKLEASFKALSPSCRREYAEYVTEAKREETRVRRVDKIIPMILEKKSLNDKYR